MILTAGSAKPGGNFLGQYIAMGEITLHSYVKPAVTWLSYLPDLPPSDI